MYLLGNPAFDLTSFDHFPGSDLQTLQALQEKFFDDGEPQMSILFSLN